MMSSRHIRATKIKHASPPSAGWLLSLGLKTVVTHEQSSQTKTCTLCKSQRDSAYSKHTHTGVQCFHVHCVFVIWYGLFAPKLFVLPDTRMPFQDSFEHLWLSFHLLYLSPGPQQSFLVTLRKSLNPLSSPLQPINHYPPLQFGALQFPLDQLALRRQENEAAGGEDRIINLGSYYFQIGQIGLKANLQTGNKTPYWPLMNTIKCAVQLPVFLGIHRPKWQSCFILWSHAVLCLACVFPPLRGR